MTGSWAKMKRHARKFSECGSPEVVLKRYMRIASEVADGKMQQYMSHVSAWIVLAQHPKDAVQLVGKSELSPVRVLLSMLRLRGRARLSDRLWAAMRAVKTYSENALRSAEEQNIEHEKEWHELLQSLPALHKRPRIEASLAAEEADDVFTFKRLRRLQNSVSWWRSCDTSAAQIALAKIGQRLTCVAETNDALQLRQIIYELIGCLSPPRLLLGADSAAEPMDIESQERLRRTAEIQKQARKYLLEAISIWRCDLSLDDEQITPILDFIGNHIKRFEKKSGSLNRACASDDWLALRLAVLGDDPELCQQEDQIVRETRKSRSQAKPSKITDGVWEPNDRVKALSTCVHVPEETKQLFCPRCRYSIQSAWYFVHPTSKEKFVLVPQKGHTSCSRLPVVDGKARGDIATTHAIFAPADGTLHKKDKISNVDYCIHSKLRTECIECGNREFCEHGKRKNHCGLCQHLVKRRKRR